MQTRKNAVLLAFMMILTSLLLLVSLSANITHAAENGSTSNGQTQQFNKGEGKPDSKDSKSSSKEASSSKGTNSEDNSTTQSNQTATVTINKIASDTQKQLAGAHLQIIQKLDNNREKVVKVFTTNGVASVFNLPKGNYILRETGAPKGYALASDKPFTVNDENVTTTTGTTVGAGTGAKHNKIYVDPLKEEIYIVGKNNQTELGYCFNIRKFYPDNLDDYKGVYYDRTSISDGSPVNTYMHTPRQENDEDSLKAIRTIIWNGFASNPDNIQKKYGLTDDELYRITQRAVWYYTDSVSDDYGKPYLGTLGMPKEAKTNVSKEVLQNALEDIINPDPNSPIPTGMAIDFFIPDNDSYQNVLAASFTSTSTKPGKPVPVTLEDKPKHDTSEDKPKHDTSEDKPKHDTSEDKPKHDTSEDKPKHDTSEDKPKHDTSEDKPKHDTSEDKPKHDTSEDKPKHDTSEDKPKHDTSEDKPKHDTSEDKPKHDTSEDKPKHDTSEDKPKHDTSEDKPKHDTSEDKPKHDTSEDKPKHDTSEDKPKHDTSEDKPKHDTSEDKPKHDTSEDKPKHDTSEDKPKHDTPTTEEVEQPKATTPTTEEVEQPKATTPTTEEVVQPKATEQPSDNTATQKNNDDDFYAIPVKAQTTDKKAKVNHQKAVYKTNNSQKMPKATSVVYTANNSEALPKTGAKQSALIVLIGLGMVVLSGFLYKKEF